MKRTFLLAAALVAVAAFCGTQAQAQVVVGGTGGATTILRDGKVTNAGTILAEIGYDSALSETKMLEITQFTGISADGGGPTVGLGGRFFFRVGQGYHARYPYVGVGIGGFGLGEDTPKIDELSVFVGPEFLVRLPIGDQTSVATGFVGMYPSVAGQEKTVVLRTGVSLSIN